MEVLGLVRTRQFFVYFAKNDTSADADFFPPNFVKPYQTSKAPSSCIGAGQIFIKCENRTDFAIYTV